jgi:hypothetical protein
MGRVLGLALNALSESPDVDDARSDLRRYLKGGEIALTPKRFEGRETYVARAEFLPLVFLTEKCSNASESYQKSVVHVWLRGGDTHAGQCGNTRSLALATRCGSCR